MMTTDSVYSSGLRWVEKNLMYSCILGMVASVGSGPLLAQGRDGRAVQEESSRRAENLLLAQELLLSGDAFYGESKFDKAVDNYSQAFSLLSHGRLATELKKASAQRYAQAAIEQSKRLARFGEYEEARKLLNGVLAEDVLPDHRGVKQRLAQLDDPIRTNPVLSVEHARDTESVGNWLRKAEAYYNLGKNDEALLAYEEVLLIDPYNSAARRGMQRLNRAKSSYYKSAYDETRSRALTELSAEWELKVSKQRGTSAREVAFVTEEARLQEVYANKAKQIVVPIVDLQGVTIEEAYDMVRVWSREYDRSTTVHEEKGLNFVLNIGDKNSDWGKVIRAKRVTLNLRNVPLDKVLDYISRATGTQWRFSQYAVVVTPSGAADTTIVRRSFSVPPSFMREGVKSSGGNADPFAEDADEGALTSRGSAKELLKRAGVNFPEGASAKYLHGTGTLMVANTAHNMDLIEQYVRSFAKDEKIQVVLKVTIMEILKSDVDELGFDWLLAPGNEARSIGGGSTGNGNAFTIPGAPTNASPVTSGLRSGDSMFTTSQLTYDVLRTNIFNRQDPQRAPGVLTLRTEEVAVIMRGLSQKKSVDRLDTPTIIMRSGEKATLFSGQEMIYPTEYDPPQLPNNASTSADGVFPVVPAFPTSYETRMLGTQLEAECTISEDRNYVDVHLVSELSEFDGFVNYGSPITIPQLNPITGNVETMTLAENPILMPIFRAIKTNTAVTVQDGASFVIAGLNQTDIQKVEDKVPLLGDLPIVGRFFKSEGLQKSDRALFIFVNVELKDPMGKNWRDR